MYYYYWQLPTPSTSILTLHINKKSSFALELFIWAVCTDIKFNFIRYTPFRPVIVLANLI